MMFAKMQYNSKKPSEADKKEQRGKKKNAHYKKDRRSVLGFG